MEQISEAFVAVDDHARITYVNGPAERILGASREDLTGTVFAWSGDGARFEMRSIPTSEGRNIFIRETSRAERELAELELIYQTAPVGLLFLDTRLHYVRINRRLAEINGRPVEAHIGRSIFEVLPDIAPVVAPDYLHVLRTGEPIIDKEIHGITPAQPGVERWFKASYYPVKDSQAGVLGVTAVVEEVTEQRRFEAALYVSEQWRHFLANALHQFIWVANHEGVAEFLNQYWYDYTGMQPGEDLHKRWRDFIHPDDAPLVADWWRRANEIKTVYELEYRLKRACDQSYRWHLAQHAPILSKTGEIVKWVGTGFDIEDRKRNELHLREARTLLMEVVNGLSESFLTERARTNQPASASFAWNTDAEGKFTTQQQGWEHYTGQTLAQYRRRAVGAVHPDDAERVAAVWLKAIQERCLIELQMRLWHAPTQGFRHVISRGVPLLNPNGTIRGWTGTISDVHERKLAEEALLENERRFMNLTELTPAIVWTAKTDGTSDFYNSQWFSYTGQSQIEAAGWGWTDAIHPDDSDRCRERWTQSIKGGEPYEADFRLRKHDGAYRWFVSRAVPLRNEQDEILKWFGTATDIHDRKLAAEAIYEANQKLQAIFQASPLPIVAFDTKGVVALWNPAAERLFGWTASEVLGGHLPFIPFDKMEEHRELRSRGLRGESLSDLELRRQRKDGGFIDLSVSTAPLRDETGKIVGIMSLYQDVTEQNRTRQALQSSKERYEFLAEALPQIVWIHRADGTIEYGNRYWGEYTGLSPGQGAGHGWTTPIHPADVPRVLAAGRKAAETHSEFRSEYRLRSARDGAYRWHLARARPYQDSDGDWKWLGTSMDIHDRMAAEETVRETNRSLERANASLKQFAYAAAHDLQEPLRMVSIYSELLSRRYKAGLDQDGNEYLSILYDAALRMQDLVHDLLELTRVDIEANDPEAVDLNAVLQRCIDNLRTAILESKAVIKVGDLPVVTAHPSLLAQLFQNLIANALKYRSGEAPRIEIGCVSNRGQWKFSVRDNGIGIAPEYHEQIFGLFKRLHRAQYPGTGIGLAICTKVVETYGGRIWVDSQEGQGSVFYFTLPKPLD